MNSILYLVYPNQAEAGALETVPNTKGMIIISEDDFKLLPREKLLNAIICITSEACLDTVLKSLEDQKKVQAIKSLKDKYLFRTLLTEIFPSYNFTTITLDEITTLKLTSKKVIKPAKGCFGTAVKIVDNKSDLYKVKQDIQLEIKKNANVLPKSVLSDSKFLLEDFIEGEEYAIDMYYSAEGEPKIITIYHHPLPKHKEYLHMLYYTNKLVYEKVYEKAIVFFKQLNQKLKLTSTTLHAEFKLNKDLIPIEINPLRFGGMGLGNMIFHGLTINPYELFLEEKVPNWDMVWQENSSDNIVFIIAYNGTNINIKEQVPDYEKLEKQFTKICNSTKLDYKQQLTFGIYTLKETSENIQNLLTIEFNDFFKDITDTQKNRIRNERAR